MRRIVLLCVLAVSTLMLGSSDPVNVIPTSTGQDYLDEDGDERYSENALELKEYIDWRFEQHEDSMYPTDGLDCGSEMLVPSQFIDCMKQYVDENVVYESNVFFWGVSSMFGQDIIEKVEDKLQALEDRIYALENPE